MDDAYQGIGRLYLALLTPECAAGEEMGDPVMARWADTIPDGSIILDACCGIGNDVLAMHRMGSERGWQVFGADLSSGFIGVARTRAVQFGIEASRFQQCAWEDLGEIDGWQGACDVVIAPYAIYTAPDGVGAGGYDAFLARSLAGIRRVMKPGGRFLTNTRDWARLAAAGFPPHHVQNSHDDEIMRCRYTWQPGPTADSEHVATLRFDSVTTGETASSTIRFVGRTVDEMVSLIEAAGFRFRERDEVSDENETFVTFMFEAV